MYGDPISEVMTHRVRPESQLRNRGRRGSSNMLNLVFQGPSGVALTAGKRVSIRQTGLSVMGKVITRHFGHRLSLRGTNVCHI